MSKRRLHVVIVGAGSCGSVLANRLSADSDLDVTVIEAGPDFPPDSRPADLRQSANPLLTQYDWEYQAHLVEDAAGTSVHYPRGKVVGGSSTINGAVGTHATRAYFMQSSDSDTRLWTWTDFESACRTIASDHATSHAADCSDGPITLSRIPESTWPEMFQQIVARLRDDDIAWRANMNDADDGVGCTPRTEDEAGKSHGLRSLIDPVRGRSNLTLLADTEVERLGVENGRVTGVWIDEQGTSRFVAADRVLLCAGVIGTPVILWRSGIGDRDDLAASGVELLCELPAVGRNLADHPRIGLLLPSREPLDGAKGIMTMCRWSSGSGPAGDSLMFLAVLTPQGAGLTEAPSDDVVLVSCTLASPTSRGRLHPATTGSGRLGVEVRLNMLSTAADRERLRAITRRACTLITAVDPEHLDLAALPPSQVLADDVALDEWIRQRVRTAYHPVGTCVVGDDPRTSVVDHRLAVHGLDGVSIVDASVLPPIPNAPTNMTCYALAEFAFRSGLVEVAATTSVTAASDGA